jgi:hypothetical protein
MSELPTTTTDIPHWDNNSTSQDDVSQKHHCLLLFLEASAAMLLFSSLFTFLLGFHIYSGIIDFGIIAGISIIALGSGIRAAAHNRTPCLFLWRAVLHFPFLFEICNAWSGRKVFHYINNNSIILMI